MPSLAVLNCSSRAEFCTTKSRWFFPAFGESFPRCLTLPWFLHRGETEIFFPTARYFVFLGYSLLCYVSKVYPRVSSDVSPSCSWDLFWWCGQSAEKVVKTETMFLKPGVCKNLFWAITDATGHMEQLGDLHQDYKCSADLHVPDSVGGFPIGTESWGEVDIMQITNVHDFPVEKLPQGIGNSISLVE